MTDIKRKQCIILDKALGERRPPLSRQIINLICAYCLLHEGRQFENKEEIV